MDSRCLGTIRSTDPLVSSAAIVAIECLLAASGRFYELSAFRRAATT